VTAVNEQTNISSKTVTGVTEPITSRSSIQFLQVGSGSCWVSQVPPVGITIDVSQKATINVKMEVGTLNERSPFRKMLPRRSGNRFPRQVVDNKKVEALPLNGRMIFMLNQIAAASCGASQTWALQEPPVFVRSIIMAGLTGP